MRRAQSRMHLMTRGPMRSHPTSNLLRVAIAATLMLSFTSLLRTPVRAQPPVGGFIAISTSPIEVTCGFLSNSPGIHTIYVRHTFSAGVMASRFRIEFTDGAAMTYLSQESAFLLNGDASSGISVCYNTCLIDNEVILKVDYLYQGTSFPCEQFRVLPHPAAQTVEAISCGSTPVRASAQDMYLVGFCGCLSGHLITGTAATFDCAPVPVATRTWGAIKAMYR